MVIEGPSFLDDLENSLVLSQILKISNKRIQARNLKSLIPFQTKNLGKFIKFQGKKNKLSLFFFHEEIQSKFKVKPLDFILNLIANKNENSLYYILKEELQIISSLKVKIYENNPEFAISQVTFTLN